MPINLPLKAKCLVDSNIIYYAISFKKTDIAKLLVKVYGRVFIHVEVYNELSSAGKAVVQEKWNSGEWEKFDPSTLTPTESTLYRRYTSDIQAELNKVDAERGKKGQRGLGEIHSMAAALIMKAFFQSSLTSIYEEDPKQYKHLMKLFKAEIPPQE